MPATSQPSHPPDSGDPAVRAATPGRVVILDGAVGAELLRRGVPADRVCWTALAALTHAEVLAAVHAEHVAAGAEIVTANTFATCRFVLEAAGHGQDFARINAAAVAAARRAREAAERPIAIAGSISCLPPAFDTSAYPEPAHELAAYRELAETLAALGVDLLALEMMQDTEHAARAIEAAKMTGLPVWVGLSCRRDAATGELVGFDFPATRFADVAAALAALEPDAINVMHTPVDAVMPALELLGTIWRGRTGAYPELGSFDPVSRKRSGAVSPERFALSALAWKAAGTTILGGCCGATPAHIAALSAALR